MMIDRARLAGEAAYLRVPGMAGFNIAGAAGAVSVPLAQGMQLAVAAVDLLIEGDHLERLFARSGVLLALEVRKEMFPGLFADPFRHRVHTLAGYEDFNRGTLARLEVLELDGYPTLVSTDAGPCVWQSAVYRIPHAEGAPALFTGVAWDMGTTRLAAREGLDYHLAVRAWPDATSAPVVVMLAGEPTAMSANPGTPRWRQAAPGAFLFKASAYQIVLEAAVGQDTAIAERHVGEALGHSLGRPILRAVNLLEQTDSAFEFRSLQELFASGESVKLVENPPGNVQAISLKLPLRAKLAANEHISLSSPPGTFARLEARIDGTMSLQPPDPDRPGP